MLNVIAMQSRLASVPIRIAIACGLIVLGAVLASDFRGITSRLRKDSSGFTPWGRKRTQRLGVNPGRIAGLGFIVFGVITLLSLI